MKLWEWDILLLVFAILSVLPNCSSQILGINQNYFRGLLSGIPVIANRNIEFRPSTGDTANRPVVTISDGSLRGFTLRTVNGRAISSFQSIPYARPPVGTLRFQDPIKNEPWNGIRDALPQSPTCTQMDANRLLQLHGQEDCLYLNVYAPQRPSSQNGSLPVMVFFHGGAFFWGAGNLYGPRYLLDHDVILVTLNYRLGPFGFFSTGDDASPGNQGMKDQVLALKWVQENIAVFGGNPNSVTIFGQSAGAGSVGLHFVSPKSRGLFHRGISESGSAFCLWADLYNASMIAKRVGEIYKCPTESSQEMIECLQKVPAKALAPAQLALVLPLVVFAPTVEHEHPGAFITKHPEQYYEDGEVANVTWIAGLQSNELSWVVSALISEPIVVNTINTNWDTVGPIMLVMDYNTTEVKVERARRIWDYYMGNRKLSWETRHDFVNLFGDRLMMECTLEQMRYHSMYTKQSVYGYRLSYQGRYSVVQHFGQKPENWGVAHLDDLIYLFNNPDYHPTLYPGDPELEMSNLMTSVWTNFATHDRPYLPNDNTTIQTWQPLAPGTDRLSPIQLLDLNLNPKMIDDPFLERYRFWRALNINP